MGEFMQIIRPYIKVYFNILKKVELRTSSTQLIDSFTYRNVTTFIYEYYEFGT